MHPHHHTASQATAAGSEEIHQERARRIAVFEVGPLLGERDRLIGIVTDRDIVVRGLVEGKQDAPGRKGWPRAVWVP
jgi:CBS domain-containing protein